MRACRSTCRIYFTHANTGESKTFNPAGRAKNCLVARVWYEATKYILVQVFQIVKTFSAPSRAPCTAQSAWNIGGRVMSVHENSSGVGYKTTISLLYSPLTCSKSLTGCRGWEAHKLVLCSNINIVHHKCNLGRSNLPWGTSLAACHQAGWILWQGIIFHRIFDIRATRMETQTLHPSFSRDSLYHGKRPYWMSQRYER